MIRQTVIMYCAVLLFKILPELDFKSLMEFDNIEK